ncbi:hypothetical protein KFK09_013669 [Dendrobium nobile]|uniref:Uncharacterized protein n=1 Tax=Dendrobium nobile TaxID=94219 RepID=A0A8T3B7Z5_DENNO|nr:hypothetical protein KFK09_013669 [Dendrobium nobile]
MTFSTSLCIKPFSSRHPRRRRRRQQRDDPSSPKVGCMGIVNPCKAVEKAEAAPPPPLPPPQRSCSRRFYFLMASVAFLVPPMNSKKRMRTTRPALMGRRVVSVEEIERPLPVAVEEMDPPLPVAVVGKRERKIETPALSLWKRRCRSRKLEELFFCRPENLPAAIAGIVV